MSGLVMVVLAGLLLIGVAIENYRRIVDDHVDAAERESQRRLMNEIRKQR